MRSSIDSTNLQNQHYQRLCDLLLGSSIEIESSLLNIIQKNGKNDKQIDDVQIILNEHRLKILQNTIVVIESIVNSVEVKSNIQNFKKTIEEQSAKYRQIQMLLQMKSVLNNKITQKIDSLNNLQEENKIQIVGELQVLNDSLTKVEQALSQISNSQDAYLSETGFSVFKDLQINQHFDQDTIKNGSFQEMLYQEKNNKKNRDYHNYFSNIYLEETKNNHDSTNLYANQEFQSNLTQGNNNNQSNYSYYKTPKEDLFHSNLKLITPIAQKMHSIGYKTEPDSAMTPLHSDYIIKNSIYKTPSDSNNKRLFKNNLNALHQSNFDSIDINLRINSNDRENSNSYNPPALQIQGGETVSAGDLISPQILDDDERQIREQNCTSFNKSDESSNKQFTLQFDVSMEKVNDCNLHTFGNGAILQNNLRTENRLPLQGINSLFTNKLVLGTEQNQQIPEDNKNKLLDMFDACLNSLQQPDLMGYKKSQKVQDETKQQIIEEDERQNESIDDFVLNDKEIIDQFLQNNENNQQNRLKEQQSIKFNDLNNSNEEQIEESKGEDNLFFTLRDPNFYQQKNVYYDNQRNNMNEQDKNNDNKFVSTFGLNSITIDEKDNFMEQKFEKNNFEINQYSNEKQFENKMSVLKKQLFLSNPIGNKTAQFKEESLFQSKTNFDTIKPVISRKDEMEALGEENSIDVEQFKIIEETQEFYEKNQNKQDEELQSSDTQFELNENSGDIYEVKTKKNRKLFQESNKFYNTMDENIFKEVYQNKFLQLDEDSLNYQIEEEEQENEQIQQEQEEKYYDEENNKIGQSSQKQLEEDNENQDCQEQTTEEVQENQDEIQNEQEGLNFEDIQIFTLKEGLFMQPFSQEISKQSNQQQNLVNEFFIQPKEQKQDFINDESENCQDKLNKFDYLNVFIEKKEQQSQNQKNNFGVEINDLLQNKKFESSQKLVSEKKKSEEISKADDVLNTEISQSNMLQESIRFNELRKCRIFGAKDFFFNQNNSNEKYNSEEQNEEQNEEQKEGIECIQSKQLIQINNNIFTNLNKCMNNVKNDQQEFNDSDEDFERDETLSFENHININIQKPKYYQNFIKPSNKTNIQNKQITFSNNLNNKIKIQQQDEDDNHQKEKLEFLQTAHFLNQENQLNQTQQNSFKDSISKQNIQMRDAKKVSNSIFKEKNCQKIQEEPIQQLKNNNNHLTFQNDQLQSLIEQQQKLSQNDLAKTTKLLKNITQDSSTNNKIQKSEQENQPISNNQTLVSSNKKTPPKRQFISQQNNLPLTQQLHCSQQQVQQKKVNNKVSQFSIPQSQEKENQKYFQNYEQLYSQLSNQNEQVNLVKTLKNIKSKQQVDNSDKIQLRQQQNKIEDIEQQLKQTNMQKNNYVNDQSEQQQGLCQRLINQNTPKNKQQQQMTTQTNKRQQNK